MRWVVDFMPRPLYPQETGRVPLIQEAGWAQGSVRKDAENPTPHRDSIPESHRVASPHTDCPTPAHISKPYMHSAKGGGAMLRNQSRSVQ